MKRKIKKKKAVSPPSSISNDSLCPLYSAVKTLLQSVFRLSFFLSFFPPFFFFNSKGRTGCGKKRERKESSNAKKDKKKEKVDVKRKQLARPLEENRCIPRDGPSDWPMQFTGLDQSHGHAHGCMRVLFVFSQWPSRGNLVQLHRSGLSLLLLSSLSLPPCCQEGAALSGF